MPNDDVVVLDAGGRRGKLDTCEEAIQKDRVTEGGLKHRLLCQQFRRQITQVYVVQDDLLHK